MKDINGNEIHTAPMLDAHGQPLTPKKHLFGKIFAGVKDGVEKAGETVKHVAEAPFKQDAPAAPAESPKAEATAEETKAAEVKPEAGAPETVVEKK